MLVSAPNPRTSWVCVASLLSFRFLLDGEAVAFGADVAAFFLIRDGEEPAPAAAVPEVPGDGVDDPVRGAI